MPRYVKTVSFNTGWGSFNSEKDDLEVNEILDRLRRDGAEILDLTVRLAGSALIGITAVYVIEYEAPRPIQ